MTTSHAATELDEHLHEFVAANMPTTDDHERAGEFVIETLEQATWAARVIRSAVDRIDEVRAAADAEVARIIAWRDEATKADEGTIEHLSAMLRYYMETRHREDERCKTVKLPHGVTLKARAQQPEWDIDADAFVAWAKVKAPDLVKRTVSYAVPAADLKATVKGDEPRFVREGDLLHLDGEVVPGVVVTDRDRKFDLAVD